LLSKYSTITKLFRARARSRKTKWRSWLEKY
jgi:hypothetical protein